MITYNMKEFKPVSTPFRGVSYTNDFYYLFSLNEIIGDIMLEERCNILIDRISRILMNELEK